MSVRLVFSDNSRPADYPGWAIYLRGFTMVWTTEWAHDNNDERTMGAAIVVHVCADGKGK